MSARHALRGVGAAWRTESNFRIEIVAFALVLLLAGMARVAPWEWIAIFLVSGMVLVVELLNSAVERLLDLLKPRLHGYARDVKDVMAGATFLVSVCAAVVGFVIFLPRLLALLHLDGA
ncbi:MAG: diacylglycerol kinase [bacterium]|nr:diacylglycerol kinase [bacterium]